MRAGFGRAEVQAGRGPALPLGRTIDDLKKVDLKGETLTIFGPWRGEDEALVRSVLDYFTEATGVEIKYSSSENYEQQIVIDTQAGSPPNIAILPQPGLIQDLASKGLLTPLGDDTANWVKDNYGAGQSWVDLGTYKDKDGKPGFFAFPYKADVKSLVWYSPDNFEEAGYKVPKTQEELADARAEDHRRRRQAVVHRARLGRRHRLAGDRLGRGHHAAHPAARGLRQVGQERDPVQRSGGRQRASTSSPRSRPTTRWSTAAPQAVAATDFRDSPKGLFAVPPKCYLHHQASFIPSFFPEGTKLGEDADFFYFPPYASKPELGKPVLGAGTLAMITKDSPAARAFIDFLKMPLAHEIWMAQSGFLTPFKSRQHRCLCQRRAEEAGRDPGQRHDLPLRRLRPDARQDRRRRLLDRHGRLRRRQVRAGCRGRHPEEPGTRSSSALRRLAERRAGRRLDQPLDPAAGDGQDPQPGDRAVRPIRR